jgi:hypothetical protein
MGKLIIPYMKWKIKTLWNHQPAFWNRVYLDGFTVPWNFIGNSLVTSVIANRRTIFRTPFFQMHFHVTLACLCMVLDDYECHAFVWKFQLNQAVYHNKSNSKFDVLEYDHFQTNMNIDWLYICIYIYLYIHTPFMWHSMNIPFRPVKKPLLGGSRQCVRELASLTQTK